MEGFDNDENCVSAVIHTQCVRQCADSAEVCIQSSELFDNSVWERTLTARSCTGRALSNGMSICLISLRNERVSS